MISILGIGINFILYSFFPFESFYLIPSIPFLLYMVLKFAYINQEIYGLNLRKVFGMILLIIFINGFIDINLWKRNSAGKMSISKPFIGHGFVLADFYKRKSLLNEAQYLLTEGNFNRPCLILSGWHYAIIRVQKKLYFENRNCDCEIAQIINENKLKELLNSGTSVYYTSGVESQLNTVFNYTIENYPEAIYLNFED